MEPLIKKSDAFGSPTKVVDTCQLTGTEKEMIAKCKKIRTFARMGKMELNGTPHGTNKTALHLFKFIKQCGFTPKQFVMQYLKDLQPFTMEIIENQSVRDNGIICFLDVGYKYALYLKVQFNAYDVMVVSFHENQLARIKKKFKMPEYSLLLCNQTGEIGSNSIMVDCKVPRGFCNCDVRVYGQWVADCVLKVVTEQINDELLNFANDILEEISEGISEPFDSIQQVSFTAYGFNVLNNISLLVDYVTGHRVTPESLNSARVALQLKVDELRKLPEYEECKDALLERYSQSAGIHSVDSRELLTMIL